jgi:NitT/TauT family transport system substrate-binding protein
MDVPMPSERSLLSLAPNRRNFLKSFAAASLVLPAFGGLARAAEPVGSAARPLKLAWNAGSACVSTVAYAKSSGLFTKHGVEVELVNFSGSTDQLLEAIATGKADAGVGMALRWLKPLEQGFDVKIPAGLHGGCLRLIASKASGIATIADLKGKTVAVADMASPAKNFFSVQLVKAGLDPTRDVEWRQYPGNLLGLAIEKGEAHALADNDPVTWTYRKDPNLVEIATNLSGEYHDRTCCLLGVRGSLIRDDKAVVARLTEALFDGWHTAASNPEAVAKAFVEFTPKASQDDVVGMLKSHHHHQQVTGDALRGQIVKYVDELKLAQVFRPSTDAESFARRITADVLA